MSAVSPLLAGGTPLSARVSRVRMHERKRKRPREERRSRLQTLARLPPWALAILTEARARAQGLPDLLREIAAALRVVARVLEQDADVPLVQGPPTPPPPEV